MKLTGLFLYRSPSDPSAQFTGSLTFSDGKQEIKLTVDEEISEKIIKMCGDSIVESAKRVSDEVEALVILTKAGL